MIELLNNKQLGYKLIIIGIAMMLVGELYTDIHSIASDNASSKIDSHERFHPDHFENMEENDD